MGSEVNVCYYFGFPCIDIHSGHMEVVRDKINLSLEVYQILVDRGQIVGINYCLYFYVML